MITLDYPISTNRIWRSVRGRVVLSSAAQKWKAQCVVVARAAGIKPIAGPVAVTLELHPKLTARGAASKTRLDVDAPIKLTLDALQGVAYDNDRQVVHVTARLGPPMPRGGLTVSVSPWIGF